MWPFSKQALPGNESSPCYDVRIFHVGAIRLTLACHNQDGHDGPHAVGMYDGIQRAFTFEWDD